MLLAVLLLGTGLAPSVHADDLKLPKIFRTVEPRFPLALGLSPLAQGEARVSIRIDAMGQLTDLLVTGYTSEEFANEAVAALRQWRFEPARRNGEPIDFRINLSFQFSAKRIVTLMPLETPDALLRNAGVDPGVNLICSAGEIDHPLAVLRTVTPVHPGLSAALPHGRAVLDFYVDGKGRARLPVVAETTHPAFADAALRALADWQFSVPTHQGHPVIVRMQQEFIFTNGS